MHRHQLNLEEKSLTATSEVRRGQPAEEIVRATEATEANLVILGTHGTIGTQAFWSGAVAAKVARKTVAPVLLVPAASASNQDE